MANGENVDRDARDEISGRVWVDWYGVAEDLDGKAYVVRQSVGIAVVAEDSGSRDASDERAAEAVRKESNGAEAGGQIWRVRDAGDAVQV